jgi:hypothetical protein
MAPSYSAGLGAGLSRVRVCVEPGNISLHHHDQTGIRAYTASYAMGTRGPFLRIKRPERETVYSPPSSAEVKNA